MCELMNKGERPRRLRVVIIDHRKRRDSICKSKPAESIYIQRAVVAPKIADQQYEASCRFGAVTQVAEGSGGILPSSEGLEIEVKCLLDRDGDSLWAIRQRHGAHVGHRLCLISPFQRISNNRLSRPDIT